MKKDRNWGLADWCLLFVVIGTITFIVIDTLQDNKITIKGLKERLDYEHKVNTEQTTNIQYLNEKQGRLCAVNQTVCNQPSIPLGWVRGNGIDCMG